MGIGMMSMIVIMVMGVTLMFMMMVMTRTGSNSLNMMVMAFLGKTHFCLKSQNLFPILAELAIHLIPSLKNFIHAFRKGIQHERMVIKIGSFDEFNLRMPLCHELCVCIDSFDQNPGEKKVRENHNLLESES